MSVPMEEIKRRMIEVNRYILCGEWMGFGDMAVAIDLPDGAKVVGVANSQLKGWPGSPGIAIPLHKNDGTCDWARSENDYPNSEQIHRLVVNLEAKMGLPSDRPWPQDKRVRPEIIRQRMEAAS